MSASWALAVLQAKVDELTKKLAAADARGDILEEALRAANAKYDALTNVRSGIYGPGFPVRR